MASRREETGAETRASEVLETLAEGLPGTAGRASWSPRLLLAFGADGLRGPEWLDLEGERVELGRGADLFPGGPVADPRMSRRHLCLRRVGPAWQVEDLGSRNGSRLSGQPVRRGAALANGDVLRAGDSLFIYVEHPAPDPVDDVELVGISDATVALRRALDKVAPHDTTVLLTGHRRPDHRGDEPRPAAGRPRGPVPRRSVRAAGPVADQPRPAA